MEVTRTLLGNRPFRFVVHLVFVAMLSLLVNEIRFFQQSQDVANEFVQATQGMILFEPDEAVSKDSPLPFQGRLETYFIQMQSADGEPKIEVLTDATSSTFFKLERAHHIKARKIHQENRVSVYLNGPVFLGSLPTMISTIQQEPIHALTQNWVYWKLGLSLFQESFLMKKVGMVGWGFFLVSFISCALFFSQTCRQASQKIGQMRFLGVPNHVLIPLLFLKNMSVLLFSFLIVMVGFKILEIYIPLKTYLISFFLAFLLAGITIFFRRLNLDFKR